MGESSLGAAILDLTADPRELAKTMDDVHGDVEKRLGKMGGMAATALTGIVAGFAALGAGAAVGIKVGVDATLSWGQQLDELTDIFGMSDESALGFATALGHVGMSVDEGMAGISYLVRQIGATNEQLATAKENFGAAAEEIRSKWNQAVQDAADQRVAVWGNLAEQTQQIEENLAESVENIQYNLNEKLEDIARERSKIDADTTKALAKLETDTKERLRDAHSARERKRIKADAKERKQEILDAAAERKADLDRQEAREREHAKRQMDLAERVAQKQIDAAERAADKQIAAIDKALAREEAARDAAMKKASKALSDVETRSPLSKALDALGLQFKDITDKSGNFTEEGLAKIMDAFAKLPESANASAIAMQLFGRSGMEWLEFLRLGSKGLDDFRKKGLALGLGVSTRDIKEFGFALNDLKLAVMGVGVTIGKHALPYVKQFVEWLTKGIEDALPALNKWLNRLDAAFKSGGLAGVAKEFWKSILEPGGIADQVGQGLSSILAYFASPEGKKRGDEIAGAFSALLGGAITTFFRMATWIGDALGALIGRIATWASSDVGKKQIDDAGQALMTALMATITGFLSILANVAGVMSMLLYTLQRWSESDEGKKQIGDFTQAFSRAVIDGLGAMFSRSENGQFLLVNIGNSIMSALQSLSEFIANIGANIAMSLIGGFVNWLLGPDAEQAVKDALTYPLSIVLQLGIGPGGPMVQLPNIAGEGLGALSTQFQDALNNLLSQIPQFQTGGRVAETGLAYVHAGEFVLNPEQMQSMPVASSTSSSHVTYELNVSHTWNASVSAADKYEIEGLVRETTRDEMTSILGQFGGG